MLRRTSTILILSLLVVALLAMSASAVKSPDENKKVVLNPYVDKSLYYSFPDEHNFTPGTMGASALGSSDFDKGSASPGLKVGDSWYDYQHNGTIGRMITSSAPGGTQAGTHFSWMFLPNSVLASRKLAYNYYNASASPGALASAVYLQNDDEYAGYVAIDVTPDNRAVVGGHNDDGSGYASQVYYDFGEFLGFFSANDRVPNDIQNYGDADVPASQEVIWPKMRYQVGTDTVLHLFAQVSEANAADPQAVYYFRRVIDATPAWDDPPRIVDTVFNIAQDVACDPDGDRVALVWNANLPQDADPCDTCSDNTGDDAWHVQWDNDVYYQISEDQGVTWQPRVNITQYERGVQGWRSYTSMSALMDSDNNLHIVWAGPLFPANSADGWRIDVSRLFHWSEDNPYIRTVHDASWFQTTCLPGAWDMTIAKMQVSECDGKIYCVWVQFNNIPGGVEDDCAARAEGGSGDVSGASNGELWVKVSEDGGLTWDAPRNLTNSYTPNCDPANGGIDCASDHWLSVARYGRANQGGEDWAAATVVDPSGSYSGSPNDGEFYYLDVQYIDDKDAGGVIQDEGTWQLADVRWFRMACVEPIPNPQPVYSFARIDDPAWAKPNTQLDTTLLIENTGNVTWTYTVIEQEDNGTAGWLAVSGASGSIPSGLSNTESVTISLNNGGVEAGPIELVGRVIFDGNQPSDRDTIPINFFVVDTLVPTSFDTLETACMALVVGSNGNVGHEGDEYVNLDWQGEGDCWVDTATVYLYDGSPVVGWIDGTDTTMFWALFGTTYLDSTGFRSIVGECSSGGDGYNIVESDTFVTQDSTIALHCQWVGSTHTDSCDFVIQRVRVWSWDGAAHNGLVIGQAVDWDIPTDTASVNNDGIDPARNLIYQTGVDYPRFDTAAGNCQPNANRLGGMAFLESFVNGSQHQTVPYGAYTAENDSFVYPASGFVPGELYENMQVSGFAASDSTEDLHMVMTYEPSFNLGAGDVYEAYIVYATVMNGNAASLGATIDKAEAWYNNHAPFVCSPSCCYGYRGNVDNVPDASTENTSSVDGVDVGDLVYFVNYSFGGASAPPCEDEPGYYPEADIDGSHTIDIGDVVALVNYSFGGGADPFYCGVYAK